MIVFIMKRSLIRNLYLPLLNKARSITVLGIETSCDDTGVGLVNDAGVILGEHIRSQQDLHVRFGGIIPPIAQNHHRENIDKAVRNCINGANIDLRSINAIAVTNRPGLPMSLTIGIRYAKHLARIFSKPLIPIHHMEAHALTARINQNIPFPYICLLVSGGHCQLALVKNVNNFYLLGETLDDAPGEAFDKIARRLKLRNIFTYEGMSGGAAIELAASQSETIHRYEFPLPLVRNRDCQFSFAGLKNNAERLIKHLESELGADEVIPSYKEFCASFLKAITRHICHRTQRALEYCLQFNLIPETSKRSLVIAGGVAANDFLFQSCLEMAKHFDFNTFRASKRLCSDNGVMVAWNGIEKIAGKANSSCKLDCIKPISKCSIGHTLIREVKNASIQCKLTKISTLQKTKKKN